MKDLPLESFNQSYLKKAGVNFKLNVVDTVLKKGFTLSFYLSLITQKNNSEVERLFEKLEANFWIEVKDR